MARITPTLAQLLVSAMDSQLNNLHTAMPCRVASYDAATQTANLQPQIKNPVKTEDGEVRYEELPILPNVPVAFPRGGNGFYMTFPLTAGDFGMVIFSERSIDEWRSTGTSAEPLNDTKHPLQGAVFFPMGYPDTNKLTDSDASSMAMGRDTGANIKITIGDIVELNGNEDNAALASIVNSNFIALRDWADVHVHTGVTTGAGVSATTSPFAPSLFDTSSDKVKIGEN